jgi:hypothetical protein
LANALKVKKNHPISTEKIDMIKREKRVKDGALNFNQVVLTFVSWPFSQEVQWGLRVCHPVLSRTFLFTFPRFIQAPL